jgi:hypothetical protein
MRRAEEQKTPTDGNKHRHPKEEKICPCSFLSVWPRISRLRNEKRRRAEAQKGRELRIWDCGLRDLGRRREETEKLRS